MNVKLTLQIPLARRQDVIRQRLRDIPRGQGQITGQGQRSGQGQRQGRFDPRTGNLASTVADAQSRQRLTPSGTRLPNTGNMNPPLFRMCARPRSVRCFSWPANQDVLNAYRYAFELFDCD